MAPPSSLEGITACVDAYFASMRDASRALVERAFHPEAQVVGVDEGRLARMTRDEFAALVERKGPHPDPRGEIRSIQRSGAVATVVVADSYLGRRFVDHLSMVELDGRWSILLKTWHVERVES